MPEPVYSIPRTEWLQQGEILSDLDRSFLDSTTIGGDLKVSFVQYEYVIVVSQACDLEQDFRHRQAALPPSLPDILICPSPTADQLKANAGGSDIWKRVRQNKDERYHCLPEVPKEMDLVGSGIPSLGMDFKRAFSIPTEEAYERLRRGELKRRTVLTAPFLQHLSSRLAYFVGRVALPVEYEIKT